MFRGRSDHTIDEKGRIILPVRLRDVLNKKNHSTIMLTMLDSCLVAYPPDEWDVLERKFLEHPDGGTEMAKNFKRSFIGSAEDCPLDKQGRILVPPTLRGGARLEKNIVIVGLINHFEIWNAAMFTQNMQEGQDPSKAEALRNFRRDVGI
ncbi:MAG: division/cell wall cluster transcriptional repressor MraZ [Pseudomonadota bacterium]